MTTKISYAIAFLLGLAMVFLGARFFFAPEAATDAFGIRFNANGDYSFHHIKGIRDIFSGVLLCALVLMKERRALGMMLFVATIIPVFRYAYSSRQKLHGCAASAIAYHSDHHLFGGWHTFIDRKISG